VSPFARWTRPIHRHPYLADGTIAAVLLAVTLLSVVAGQHTAERDSTIVVAATVVAFAGLIVRRRRPFVALGIASACAEVVLALSRGHELVLAAPLIALYTVGDQVGGRRHALGVGGGVVAIFAVTHALWGSDNAGFGSGSEAGFGAVNLALVAFGGLALAVGDAARSRRAYIAEVEERARRAERDREMEVARRIAEERLRIARDLHDVVGHHLALINVQAGVAEHVLEDRPVQAHEALGHIRFSCREALGDLQQIVGLLRQPDDPAEPTEPVAGLDALPDLLDSFRRSGLTVETVRTGEPGPIPATVDLTAYRVIQESLTNAFKYAGGARVRVAVAYTERELCVEVEDDGPGGDPDTGAADSGHGIIGMRERVTALGGGFTAGTRPEGGFHVTAALPLRCAGEPLDAIP
jgi:signal transduction histidine kinase